MNTMTIIAIPILVAVVVFGTFAAYFNHKYYKRIGNHNLSVDGCPSWPFVGFYISLFCLVIWGIAESFV